MSMLSLAGILNIYSFSPWNVSSLPANVTASLNNFKLTRSGGSNSVRGVLTTVTKSVGKLEVHYLMLSTGGAATAGPAAGLLNGTIGTFLGGTIGGFGLWPNSTVGNDYTFNNNVGVNRGALATFAADTEVAWAFDFNADVAWVGIVSAGIVTWVGGGNPATGTTPTFNANLGIGAYSLAADMFYPGTVQLLLPTQYTSQPLSGFFQGWPDQGI